MKLIDLTNQRFGKLLVLKRKIEKTNNIQELQKETITIEEFIKNI